jgi:hypothetical protein
MSMLCLSFSRERALTRAPLRHPKSLFAVPAQASITRGARIDDAVEAERPITTPSGESTPKSE